jgi:hypothetical protein
VIRTIIEADHRNVHPSTTNAHPLPKCSTTWPPSAGPDDHQRERADELIDGVGPDEQVLGHELRHDRVERGMEQCLPHAEDQHEDEQDRDRQCHLDRQEAGGSDRGGPDQVRGDQQTATIHPIREHARERHDDDLRRAPRDPDEGERARAVGDREDLERHRGEVEAVPDHGYEHPGPQQPEVANPHRLDQPHAVPEERRDPGARTSDDGDPRHCRGSLAVGYRRRS